MVQWFSNQITQQNFGGTSYTKYRLWGITLDIDSEGKEWSLIICILQIPSSWFKCI